MTSRSRGGCAASHSRHMAVVACVPVPNAMPGSRIMLAASGSGGVSQLGTTQRFAPKCIGRQRSIQTRTQSWSAMVAVLNVGSAGRLATSRPYSSPPARLRLREIVPRHASASTLAWCRSIPSRTAARHPHLRGLLKQRAASSSASLRRCASSRVVSRVSLQPGHKL